MIESIAPLLDASSRCLQEGVRLDATPRGLRLIAEQDLDAMSTGRFDRPSSFQALRPCNGSPGLRFGGYSWTQFGLPVWADAELDFPFAHGRALVSPAVVFPFYGLGPGGDAILLAPLDSFHEQVLAIVDGELRWGWHGDLDSVPAEFASELGIFRGREIRVLLDEWGALLRQRSGQAPADRYADPATSHLSYWTDNGAAYWYRREPGLDLPTTLAKKCEEMRELGIPFRSFELDSWFYPHERSRPVEEIGYLDAVPPTGMLEWKAREDLLPDGVAGLRKRLGDPPLVLHSRHISPRSPYLSEGDWWVHEGVAHPRDPRFFDAFFRYAREVGATCYEQDWMWIIWFGATALRRRPGRTRAWLKALNDGAHENDLSLIWCMATPADFAEATRLPRVAAVRSCDDYRFADDPAFLWSWFLGVNALLGALGLWAFKDVFFSALGEDIDGDPHPEIEALLSALSAGPVGIGDRIGRSDPELIARTCRADGLLVKPDRPLAALDGSLLGEPIRGEGLLWADSETRDAASRRWRYLVALHVAEDTRPICDSLELARDLEGEVLVYDWRSGDAREASRIEVTLEHREWAYFVLCPVVDGRAVIGDPDRYATMGDRRVRLSPDGQVEVYGSPGERLRIRSWSRDAGVADLETRIGPSGTALVGL